MTRKRNYRSEPRVNETPFADTVCLTLHIKGQRVRPTISPTRNRPLSPEEIRYAVKVADYAARALR